MKQQYSRLARVEEKKNIRSTIIFGGLTIAFILFLIFFGIPLVARFASYVGDLKRGNTKQPTTNSNTPISAPTINTPVEFTNQTGIVIKGSAEANSKVTINVNGTTTDTTSDGSGVFSVNVSLQKGQNQIFATATNSNGTVSDKSQTYTITFSNQPPKLDISSPGDNANFYTDKQRKITMIGSTDSEVSVTVNGHTVIVGDDGNFKYDFSLSDGKNTLTIDAVDRAGNKKEVILTVNFTP